MANGTVLSRVLTLLQAELGQQLSVSNADVQQNLQLIESMQFWLADETDWPFLAKWWDVSVAGGTRYIDLPTLGTAVAFNPSRPVIARNYWNNRWMTLAYGIGIDEYNVYDSDHFPNNRTEPLQRWQHYDLTQFEVWPLSTSTQTVRFYGQRLLSTLRHNDLLNTAKTLDLDDQLIVLFVAAELLARGKNADAQLKLAKAQQRLKALKSNFPKRDQCFNLSGECRDRRWLRRVPIIGIAGGVGGTTVDTTTYITDENDNVLTDENGNPLVP